MTKKFAIAIHGGCGHAIPFIKQNIPAHEDGLKEALQKGYSILKRGGSALKAVEEAVICLEDNPLFNAGRGSALNSKGKVEMDASIMDGKNLRAGAVSIVHSVKNPIILARNVMLKTKHVFLSGYGALEFARSNEIELEPAAYFITDHQYEEFKQHAKCEKLSDIAKKKTNGTVGAVALDKQGNLAAATSTGGTANCLPGRIGDSCVIGAGCYANNKTCAVSGTGDGEFLITGVVAHTISMLVELKKYTLQKACDYVIQKRNKHIPAHIALGVISINPKGQFGISFNTQVMKRAWISTDGQIHIKIFK